MMAEAQQAHTLHAQVLVRLKAALHLPGEAGNALGRGGAPEVR